MKSPLAISSVSISSLNYFNDCGMKWVFRYHHRLPEPTSLPMVIGSTNHSILEGVNNWIKHKKTSVDRPYFHTGVRDLVTASVQLEQLRGFKRNAKEKKLSEEEFCVRQREEIIKQLTTLCDQYITIAESEFKEIVFIEKEHIFEIETIPFKLITDAVVRFKDGSLRVLDYKTKGKSSDELAVLQLVGYGLGIEDLLKEKINGLEQWDFIRSSTPAINIHQFDMSKYEGFKTVLIQEVSTFWRAIHSGHFSRNLRSMYCGPTKCTYWNVCMTPGQLETDRADTVEFHKDEVQNLDQRRK